MNKVLQERIIKEVWCFVFWGVCVGFFSSYMLSKRLLTCLKQEMPASMQSAVHVGTKEEFSVQSCEHHLFLHHNWTPLTVYSFYTATCNGERSVNAKDQ